MIAYVVLLPGSLRTSLRCLWRDVAPATVSCLALAAFATPVGWAISTAAVPGVAVVAGVAATAAVAYLLTLRLAFREAWLDLTRLIGRVLPSTRLVARTRRLAPAGARTPT